MKIEPNDGIRVSSLKGSQKVKIISLIREASLLVQYIRMLETLYIVEGIETILILNMNWFDKYKADIKRSNNKIKITYQKEKV